MIDYHTFKILPCLSFLIILIWICVFYEFLSRNHVKKTMILSKILAIGINKLW